MADSSRHQRYMPDHPAAPRGGRGGDRGASAAAAAVVAAAAYHGHGGSEYGTFHGHPRYDGSGFRHDHRPPSSHRGYGQAGPASAASSSPYGYAYGHDPQQLQPSAAAAPPLPDEPPPPPPLPDEPPPLPPPPNQSDSRWNQQHMQHSVGWQQQQGGVAVAEPPKPQHPTLNRALNFRDWREFQNTGESNNQKKKRWGSMPEEVRRAELFRVEGWLRERHHRELLERHHRQQHGEWGQYPPQQQHPPSGGGGWEHQQQHAGWQHQQHPHQHPPYGDWAHGMEQHKQRPPDGLGHHHPLPPGVPSAGEALWQVHHKEERDKHHQQQAQQKGGQKKGARQQQQQQQKHEEHPQSKESGGGGGGDSRKSDATKKKKGSAGGAADGGTGLASAMSALKSLSNRWAGKKDGGSGEVPPDATEEGAEPSVHTDGGDAQQQGKGGGSKKPSKNARKRAKRRKKAEEKRRALLERAAEAGPLGAAPIGDRAAQPQPLQQQQHPRESDGPGPPAPPLPLPPPPGAVVATVDLTDGIIDLTASPALALARPSTRAVSNEPYASYTQPAHPQHQHQHQQLTPQPLASNMPYADQAHPHEQHQPPLPTEQPPLQQDHPQHQHQQYSYGYLHGPPQGQQQHSQACPPRTPTHGHHGQNEEMDISEDERSVAAAAAHHTSPLPRPDHARPIPVTGYRPAIPSEPSYRSAGYGTSSMAQGQMAEAWHRDLQRRKQPAASEEEESELRAIWTASAAASAGSGGDGGGPAAPAAAAAPSTALKAPLAQDMFPRPKVAPPLPAASAASSASLVAEALAEKRERLALALKKAKLEKARAELRAAQKRKEELLRAKLRDRAAVAAAGVAASPTASAVDEDGDGGKGGGDSAAGAAGAVVGSRVSLTVSPLPPPTATTAAAAGKVGTLPNLAALQATNLLILNISGSGPEEAVRVFPKIGGPYHVEEDEAERSSVELAQRNVAVADEDAARKEEGISGGDRHGPDFVPAAATDNGMPGTTFIAPEIKRKKAEALRVKMELLKRKMKLMEQKERLKKRQRTEGGTEEGGTMTSAATGGRTGKAGGSAPNCPSDATETTVEGGDRFSVDFLPSLPESERKHETESGANGVVEEMNKIPHESLVDGGISSPEQDGSALQQHGGECQPKQPSIEVLRRRQLELKRSIEASTASQREIRHNMEVADLREMVNKQRRLLAQQGAKLSESSELLRECAENISDEEGALDESERNLEDLLKRKRIMEGMVLKATKKLMNGRRKRDDLLGQRSGKVEAAPRRSVEMGELTTRDQVAKGKVAEANASGGSPVPVARKRKGGARAADFF